MKFCSFFELEEVNGDDLPEGDIDDNAVTNYIFFLCACFFVFQVNRFSKKHFKNQLQKKRIFERKALNFDFCIFFQLFFFFILFDQNGKQKFHFKTNVFFLK